MATRSGSTTETMGLISIDPEPATVTDWKKVGLRVLNVALYVLGGIPGIAMTCYNFEIWTGGFWPQKENTSYGAAASTVGYGSMLPSDVLVGAGNMRDASSAVSAHTMSAYFERFQESSEGRIHYLPELIEDDNQEGYIEQTIIPLLVKILDKHTVNQGISSLSFLDDSDDSSEGEPEEDFIFIPVAYGDRNEMFLLTIRVSNGTPIIDTYVAEGSDYRNQDISALSMTGEEFRTTLINSIHQRVNLRAGEIANPQLVEIRDMISQINIQGGDFRIDDETSKQLRAKISGVSDQTAVEQLISPYLTGRAGYTGGQQVFTEEVKNNLVRSIYLELRARGQQKTGYTAVPGTDGFASARVDPRHRGALFIDRGMRIAGLHTLTRPPRNDQEAIGLRELLATSLEQNSL